MLGHLRVVDDGLASDVAQRLGVQIDTVPPAVPGVPVLQLDELPSLSMVATRSNGLQGRCVAALLTDGVDADVVAMLATTLARGGATLVRVALVTEGPQTADGLRLPVQHALDAAPSCLFDAVVVLGQVRAAAALHQHPAVLSWLRDAWRHLKVIGLDAAGRDLAKAAGIGSDDAVLPIDSQRAITNFCQWAARGKHLAREGAPGTDL